MVYLISIYEGSIFFEDLGIGRIAAYLQSKDIKTEVRYLKCGKKIDDSLIAELSEQEFVGISVYDNNIDYADEVTRRIKEKSNKTIVFYGSQYASIAYKDILTNNCMADCIVLGDGEYTILELINDYHENHDLDRIISNNSYLVSKKYLQNKTDRAIDINELPWPIHYPLYYKKNIHIDLNTASGCAGNCSFCGALRRKWSGRTPDSVYNHIVETIEKTNIRAFLFADSSFEDPGILGKKRITEIAEKIIDAGIVCSFSANIRAESFKSEEDKAILKILKKANFSQLFIGIESGNEVDLKIYNKRATLEDNRRIINLLREVGIEPFWGFIMFNPYSSQSSLYENYKFLCDMDTYVSYHFISKLTLYNGTNIYNLAKQDKIIKKEARNHVEYEFRDKAVNEIGKFIETNLLSGKNCELIKKIRDFMHFYYYLKPLIPFSEENEQTVIEHKKILCEINRQYFSYLYKDADIHKAKEYLPEFISKLQNCWEKLRVIQDIMLGQYYRTYKI